MLSRRMPILAACALGALLTAACSGSVGKVTDNLNLLVEPTTVTFASAQLNQEVTRTVTLRHAGTSGTIKLKSFYFEAGASSEFTFAPPEVDSLQPGETTTLVLKYTPTDSTSDEGWFVIDHNVQPAYKSRIRVSATGLYTELLADPYPIDFGDVEGGKLLDMDVKVWNNGSNAMTIDSIGLSEVGSKDFAIQGAFMDKNGAEIGLPVLLQPLDEIRMVMRYEPQGGGCDASQLLVQQNGEPTPSGFEVKGCELAPKLVVTPGVLDFKGVKQDVKATLLLSIMNNGNMDLVIPAGGIAVAPGGTDPNISVDDGPTENAIIPKDGNLDVHISWVASQPKPNDGLPIGMIAISSNDPGGVKTINVFGQVDAPILSVIPNPVDFLYVGQMITTDQMVTLRNDGTGELIIKSLKIEGDADGEFVIVPDPKFPPIDGSGEATIEGNGGHGLKIQFTNKGPDSGHVQAKLIIESNMKGAEKQEVILMADRAGTPTCEPVLIPAMGQFGMVPVGYSKDITLNLKNNGFGYCSFVTARAIDCTSMPPMATTCGDPMTSVISKYFTVTSVPPGIQNGIKPQQSVQIKVRFTPPPTPPIFGFTNSMAGLLGVKVYDSQLKKEIVLPTCSTGITGTSCPSNLNASYGIAKVAVMPGEVKFGQVTIGCWSKEYKVCIYNTGNAPLEVSDIAMAGCSPEFWLDAPALPANVSSGAPVCFKAAYAPVDTTTDSCTVAIKSSDTSAPSLTVLLEGGGTFDKDQTDEFVQVSGQTVDVLFVIDDSGSMCEEQDRLIANYNSFISQSKVWNNDYHVGVISVNVVDEKVMGKLNRGDAKITPRYISSKDPASVAKFADLADIGCDGGSDAQEAASQAAQLALSAPLTTDTGIACKSDSECANNTTLCGDPKNCPYYCIDGACGGWNKGFMRSDAQLEIIALSDEEDQSSSNPNFYVDFFKNIKGYYNVNMMHFNAIVGPKGGCTASDGGTAEAGNRYIDIASQTNGKIGSICDSDYSPIMNEIGAVAFGLKVQFFLTRLADGPSVQVWVNGNECKTGWKYESQSNSVLFDEAGGCMPQPGDKIKIHYNTLCLSAPQ